MPVFTVHMPQSGSVVPRAEGTKFVAEGFEKWAFVFGPFWLLWHRIWRGLAVWLVFVIALALAQRAFNISADFIPLMAFGISLYLGLEGNAWRRAALERRGFGMVDVVNGAKLEDAEQTFFARWTEFQSAPVPAAMAPTQPMRPRTDAPGIVGLFPDPRG